MQGLYPRAQLSMPRNLSQPIRGELHNWESHIQQTSLCLHSVWTNRRRCIVADALSYKTSLDLVDGWALVSYFWASEKKHSLLYITEWSETLISPDPVCQYKGLMFGQSMAVCAVWPISLQSGQFLWVIKFIWHSYKNSQINTSTTLFLAHKSHATHQQETQVRDRSRKTSNIFMRLRNIFGSDCTNIFNA